MRWWFDMSSDDHLRPWNVNHFSVLRMACGGENNVHNNKVLSYTACGRTTKYTRNVHIGRELGGMPHLAATPPAMMKSTAAIHSVRRSSHLQCTWCENSWVVNPFIPAVAKWLLLSLGMTFFWNQFQKNIWRRNVSDNSPYISPSNDF